MSKSKSRKKRSPKRVLAIPDLEHAKAAVLNSLTSVSGQRTYDHAIREFVAWYCSGSARPRLQQRDGGDVVPDAETESAAEPEVEGAQDRLGVVSHM
jgi:hypothetical protein